MKPSKIFAVSILILTILSCKKENDSSSNSTTTIVEQDFPDCNLLEVSVVKSDSHFYKTNFTYNANNQIIRKDFSFSGFYSNSINFTYNNSGQIEYLITYDTTIAGSLDTSVSLKYVSNKLSEHSTDFSGSFFKFLHEFHYNGKALTQIVKTNLSNGVIEITDFETDDNGNITKISDNKSSQSINEFEFDDKFNPLYHIPETDLRAELYFSQNNPITRKVYFDGALLLSENYTYTYLDNGLISEKKYSQLGIDHVETYTYDCL